MVVWGSCVGSWERVSRWLLPGLARNVAVGDRVALTQADRIATAYNRVLDAAPKGSRVVLLHDDTELRDGAREAILAASGDVVGTVGAVDVQSLAWWRYTTRGAVDDGTGRVVFGPYGDADTVDGLLLALSPAAAGLRFDTGYDGFHGYDADLCMQASAEGLAVTVEPVPLMHHSKSGYGNRQAWERADERWRAKWRVDGRD